MALSEESNYQAKAIADDDDGDDPPSDAKPPISSAENAPVEH